MAISPRRLTLLVQETEIGMRLDVMLSSRIENCSRSYAAQLIHRGAVKVNGACCKPSYRVRWADAIEAALPAPTLTACQPEPINLAVLYEDPDLIVINKPPGLVVHPAAGHTSGTLVNALLHHCPDLAAFGGEIRPGIVHRLDKDTSGALVVAKRPDVHEHLSRQFKDRTVHKTYLAIVRGEMTTLRGTIQLPIGRHPGDRKKMSTKAARARAAETHYRIREKLIGATLLELDLKTGRTHQIRVHCAAIHHPVLGDAVYGGRPSNPGRSNPGTQENPAAMAKRQMLHAWQLGFVHPRSGEWLQSEAGLPDDMAGLLALLRPGAVEILDGKSKGPEKP